MWKLHQSKVAQRESKDMDHGRLHSKIYKDLALLVKNRRCRKEQGQALRPAHQSKKTRVGAHIGRIHKLGKGCFWACLGTTFFC